MTKPREYLLPRDGLSPIHFVGRQLMQCVDGPDETHTITIYQEDGPGNYVIHWRRLDARPRSIVASVPTVHMVCHCLELFAQDMRGTTPLDALLADEVVRLFLASIEREAGQASEDLAMLQAELARLGIQDVTCTATDADQIISLASNLYGPVLCYSPWLVETLRGLKPGVSWQKFWLAIAPAMILDPA